MPSTPSSPAPPPGFQPSGFQPSGFQPSGCQPCGYHPCLATALAQHPSVRALLIVVLRELIDLGMAAVRDIRGQIMHPTGPNPTGPTPSGPTPTAKRPNPIFKLIASFTRIAKTVRRVIALQAAIAAGRISASKARPPRPGASRPEAPRAEKLQCEAPERLQHAATKPRPDPPYQLAGRTMADLVVEIATGLGLSEKSPTWPAALIARVSAPLPPAAAPPIPPSEPAPLRASPAPASGPPASGPPASGPPASGPPLAEPPAAHPSGHTPPPQPSRAAPPAPTHRLREHSG